MYSLVSKQDPLRLYTNQKVVSGLDPVYVLIKFIKSDYPDRDVQIKEEILKYDENEKLIFVSFVVHQYGQVTIVPIEVIE